MPHHDESALRGARVLALLALALVLPLAAYPGTARSIVAVWDSSPTFAHGFAIVPIAAWLAWRSRAELAHTRVVPCWSALGLLLALSALWFVADVADAQVARQYALAAMLPAMVLAVLGVAVLRVLAFPLAFLMLAVPFGEAFIGPLIEITASFTVSALAASGIPVLREGTQFTIPTGRWSVVEACSGVRYLIASFTLGCLFAYLNYRSLPRRALFVLLSIVVPIAANAVRAYLIVLLGHLSGNRLAAGVDHLVYGWIFFGLVMFLLFWAGSRWREEPVAAAPPQPPAPPASITLSRWSAPALAAAVAAAALPVLALDTAMLPASRPAPDLAHLVLAWQKVAPFTTWRPAYSAASAQAHGAWSAPDGAAGLSILYYRNQRQAGVKLISSTNRLAEPHSAWSQVSQVSRRESFAYRELRVRESVVSDGVQKLMVWSWYWIAGRRTANDYAGKFYQAAELLANGRDDGAALLVYAPLGDDPDEARATLRAFLGANLVRIEDALDANLDK